jgi:hypothetical protein
LTGTDVPERSVIKRKRPPRNERPFHKILLESVIEVSGRGASLSWRTHPVRRLCPPAITERPLVVLIWKAAVAALSAHAQVSESLKLLGRQHAAHGQFYKSLKPNLRGLCFGQLACALLNHRLVRVLKIYGAVKRLPRRAYSLTKLPTLLAIPLAYGSNLLNLLRGQVKLPHEVAVPTWRSPLHLFLRRAIFILRESLHRGKDNEKQKDEHECRSMLTVINQLHSQ